VKYFGLASVVLLLFFSGCKVEFVSRTDNSKVYATGTSCSDLNSSSEKAAVNALVKNYPQIAQELKEYVNINKRDINGTVCYDATVTKKSWHRYERVFKEQKEEIIAYAKRNEKIFEYKDKDILIKSMLSERRQFNNKLESAKRLAPMSVESFSLDYKSIENSIDLIPSVSIKVYSCNKNRNYNCKVSFAADVEDESKELTYLWDFGEGSFSEKRVASHQYSEEGAYNVSLQVTDEHGFSIYRAKDILVTKSKITKSKAVKKSEAKKSLKAYFIVANRSYKINEVVDFDNRSRSKSSKIKNYTWQFGDGKTSAVRNPKHQYSKAGKYVVKYKVCSDDGACAYASSRVQIKAAPKKAVPVKKVHKTAKKPVSTPQKVAVSNAKAGENIQAYIAANGAPSKKIVKKKGTTKAYKFGKVWLLVKHEKVVCAVQEEGFKTTLMGQPKKCNWHKKYAAKYMLELQ